MVSHKWEPIQPIEAQVEQYDFSEIKSLQAQWLSIKEQKESESPTAYESFLERLGRSWAIETGIIEGLYTLDRGVTETLVEKGLVEGYVENSATNKKPNELIRILRDHQDAIDFVYQHIRDGKPLSTYFIRELHIALTSNQATYQAVDQFGNYFETTLDKGGFKKLPNNPTRPDGLIHEYTPPMQVESELDNLVYLYQEYEEAREEYHPLLTGAWLHHRFTQIHPFQDGNGRVARALLTWHLVKENFLPIVITRDDRDKYITTLEDADQGGLSTFIDFIVQLEKRTILQALGISEPAEELVLVDQVVDHIVERIKRQGREKEEQLRSVSTTAESLRDTARERLLTTAAEIKKRFDAAGMFIHYFPEVGGPGDREHWYQAEIIETAKTAQHWVNLNEPRFFVKLSLSPDRLSYPRLVFVISLHHTGRQLTGIMAATAFALIDHYRQDNSVGEREASSSPDFRYCTVNPFTFTWQDNADNVTPRFTKWVEECFSIALSHWGEFLT